MSGEEKKTMRRRLSPVIALLCLGAWLALPASASAAAPKWSLSLSAFPSSFGAGASGDPSEGPAYRIVAENSGDGPTTAPYSITDVLPAGLSPAAGVSGRFTTGKFIEVSPGKFEPEYKPLACETNGQKVTCTGTEALEPGQSAEAIVPVDVATGTAGKSLRNEATVQGGGAALAKATLKTAVGQPAWKLSGIAIPTNFKAGGKGEIIISAVNVGGAISHGPVTISATLPEGLTVTGAAGILGACPQVGQTVSCTESKAIPPGGTVYLEISVDVDPLAAGGLGELTIEGGGGTPAAATIPITISPSVAPFGFLPGDAGFGAPLSAADGAAAIQAGSHPYQLTIELAWPTERPGAYVLGAGHVRDVFTDLPPGMIVNPNSTSELCVEAQLVTKKCPEGAQIGMVTAIVPGPFTGLFKFNAPLYNMVPAPGTPSIFGFEAEAGLFIHIVGSLRSDGDYGLTGASSDILAQGGSSLLGTRLQFWGDPSSSAHDYKRGKCLGAGGTCSAQEETKDALLTAPVQCSGQPTITRGRTDSWEEIGNFKPSSYESANLAGTPVAMGGCNQLQFEPSIEAKPTTNLADSPSGLDVTINQPTNMDPGGTSPSVMKDLRLVLPEGMAVNPSSADGLGACSQAQANVHTLTPSACPESSKLGAVEITTPLLDHPLPGALYLAKPFENPSGSLIGLYLAIDDPDSGTVANLAGRVQADPNTGQLTTIFENNPQLPLEGIKTHLFTGPRAALRTPAACGTYSPRADITPWSSPQTPDAHPSDSFEIGANPNGGSCPTSSAELPNSPSFTAGTLAPQAGAYSPFVLKLTRQDDTAEPQKLETTLAPGLVAKLAGVPYCPEAAMAQARSRSKPNEGAIERDNPSCPSASEIGTVDVAAGAGITPLHTQGKAYLAGPYGGAPLSVVVITPAIAGPFDLGAVVVRTALNVDPETARVTAVSDPLPRILEGIPLDIRSIAIELAKPEFTLNPTNCDPLAVSGTLSSVTGQSAALSSPFQVGGCDALSFKPKLALRLKGATKRTGHPALSATLTFPKGSGANVKRAEVTLPRSEFLDQAHIGTVCTRVQFAADQCPAASVYGKASATTPLLDQPLEGPVYLRSSSHELPDLVIALRGQVDVVLAGRVDSVKGGIRTTFEAAPDAPVRKFNLQMKGGRKGLLINSADLCKLKPKANRATVLMDGQNGKVSDSSPLLANSCKKAKKQKKHHKKKHAR